MPEARRDLLLRRAGDVWLVIDPADDRSLTLNPSAYWMLHHCDGRTHPQSLAAALSEASGIAADQAARDVDACLSQFLELRLLLDHPGPCRTSM
jgi:hypothetical protein